MSWQPEELSAYLDGELPPERAREIERALERDPELQAELESLMAADAAAGQAFAAMLKDPVPASLAATVRNAAPGRTANDPEPPVIRRSIAAACAALALLAGSLGGYFVSTDTSAPQVAAGPGWLEDIADYHRVYATQVRHLVEVPAVEADHIQTWLTATVGAEIVIPDLADLGLTFEGARLLVAAGKPVAQLMFRDAQGRVVALCAIQSDAPRDGFGRQQIDDFEMVSWGGDAANFVIVGDAGRQDLQKIAETAAQRT
jgi:anti-sigma factor RsiW